MLNPHQDRILVIGAHYDVCGNTPGADDNASGVAGLIESAGILSSMADSIPFQIQFVAYANEEPPFFRTEHMGSFVHAKSLADNRKKVEFMVSLEMIGYFTDNRGSQSYPTSLLKPFYPDTGDFIAVVSNFRSGSIRVKARKAFRDHSTIPCRTLSAPAFVPGVDFSDHLNYWKFGMKAVMITDTSFYRNRNYHETTDTADTLDYSRMSEVVRGFCAFIYTFS